jgi:hypothetical protein
LPARCSQSGPPFLAIVRDDVDVDVAVLVVPGGAFPGQGEGGGACCDIEALGARCPGVPLYGRFLPLEFLPPAGGAPRSKGSIHPEAVFQGGESMKMGIPKKTSSPWAP